MVGMVSNQGRWKKKLQSRVKVGIPATMPRGESKIQKATLAPNGICRAKQQEGLCGMIQIT